MARGTDRLREARRSAGLSQAAVAEASGLSRQAVSAIEAGRNRPSVDAALALARVLGSSVERLFADAGEGDASVGVFGSELPAGTPVLTARVGARRVHAPADLATAGERWALADAVLGDGVAEPLPQGGDDGFVVVGCDPALSLAAALLPAAGPRRLVVVNGSSRTAVAALSGGRAHAALVHGREGELGTPPAGAERLALARWRVGLATASTRPGRSLSALATAPVVQREEGAGSQRALVRALAAQGLEPPAGPVGRGHVDVARRVAAGQAPSGVTMEPAALQAGLRFTALEDHLAELWVAPEFLDHPGAQALGSVLRSRAFGARLGLVGGYELAG